MKTRISYGRGIEVQDLFPTSVQTVFNEDSERIATWTQAYIPQLVDGEPVFTSAFKEQMSIIAGDYAQSLRGGSWRADRMWVGRLDLGMWDTPHAHPGSYFVGVLYVTVPPGSGDLILLDPRGGVNSVGFTDDVGNGDNRRVFMRLTPQVGLAVFMPGYLMHMVAPHKGVDTRIAIGLNFRREREA